VDTQSYQNALISAMREAPDLLMIGEIRDQPTLQSALLFAQTGHLCMSTLHANNSYNALNRIINFFPREARESLLADLAIALRAVISQRLVRGIDGKHVPAVEILLNTKHIQDLIKTGEISQIKEALEQSLAPGSQSFEQALFYHISSGKVSVEEAMVHSDSPSNLHWLLSNRPKNTGPEDASPSSPGSQQSPGDISSIKLNLDALG
jgi:twitching motility protein PilU